MKPEKDPFRTLDEPEPTGFSVTAGRIMSGAFYADGFRTEHWKTRVTIGRPNAWRRFWWWFLLGVRWENR